MGITIMECHISNVSIQSQHDKKCKMTLFGSCASLLC